MDVQYLGGHTIGVAHCGTFSRRLYNFTGKGDADPSLNPIYANILRRQCPNPADPSITVEMDPRSSSSFDTNYFKILTQHKGLFQSDAALLTDPSSSGIVEQLQNPRAFFPSFADSMLKMAAIEILTGTDGEIRKRCRFVNWTWEFNYMVLIICNCNIMLYLGFICIVLLKKLHLYVCIMLVN